MSSQQNNFEQDLEREINDALDSMSPEEMMLLTGDAPTASPTQPGKVRGRIMSIRATDVFVDVGGKSEGFLTLDNFPPDAPPEIGREMTFFAQGIDRESGMLRLSLSEVMLEASWDSLRVGEVVEARVTGVNKGGLELSVGPIRAFMPAGQVDFNRIEDFAPLIGQRFECEVMDVNRSDENLLLSRRRVLERHRTEAREQLRYTLQPGQVRKGVVRKLMDFGAFVDIGGMDGLLHVSDISYARVKHPSEVLKEGQPVEVTILKFDMVTDKISLGLKQLQTDPWTMVPANYHPGNTIEGRVTKLMDFGAFVELEPGVEGLIPISELSYKRRVAHPREVLKEGDHVQAAIVSIDGEKHRISLSLKRLGDDPWSSVQERYKANDIVTGLVMRTTDFGAFIQLEEGIEGLAHISELSDKRVNRVTDVAKVGMVVPVRILGVDPEERRISLSIKGAQQRDEPPQTAETAALESAGAGVGGYAAETSATATQSAKPQKQRKKPLRGGLD